MADSIIGAITEFIGSCPLLEDGVLRVDAMGDEAIEYTFFECHYIAVFLECPKMFFLFKCHSCIFHF